MIQYFIKVVTDKNGNRLYFNYGIDKRNKYKNTETCLNELEYISTTVYNYFEFSEYKTIVNSLHLNKNTKLVKRL